MALMAMIDVECDHGLQGRAFALGLVLFEDAAETWCTAVRHEAYLAVQPHGVSDWVATNVMPALESRRGLQLSLDTGAVLIDGPWTHESWDPFMAACWAEIRRAIEAGGTVAADCAWPCEANFLTSVLLEAKGLQPLGSARDAVDFMGPYPLHELATMRLAAGLDPLASDVRHDDELPVHHPLADARQSARLWCEARAALRRGRGC